MTEKCIVMMDLSNARSLECDYNDGLGKQRANHDGNPWILRPSASLGDAIMETKFDIAI